MALDPSDLIEIKQNIRSLITSSPVSLTVQRLCRDYRETLGCSIPLNGYPTTIDFLKSLTDTIVIRDSYAGPIVQLISSESSAHIEKLVACQRSTVKSSYRVPKFQPIVVPLRNQPSPYSSNRSQYQPNVVHQANRSQHPSNVVPQTSSANRSQYQPNVVPQTSGANRSQYQPNGVPQTSSANRSQYQPNVVPQTFSANRIQDQPIPPLMQCYPQGSNDRQQLTFPRVPVQLAPQPRVDQPQSKRNRSSREIYVPRGAQVQEFSNQQEHNVPQFSLNGESQSSHHLPKLEENKIRHELNIPKSVQSHLPDQKVHIVPQPFLNGVSQFFNHVPGSEESKSNREISVPKTTTQAETSNTNNKQSHLTHDFSKTEIDEYLSQFLKAKLTTKIETKDTTHPLECKQVEDSVKPENASPIPVVEKGASEMKWHEETFVVGGHPNYYIEGTRIPLDVQVKLFKFISKRNEGIWIADFIDTFCKDTCCDFHPGDFGYYNIFHLLSHLDKIFRLVHPTTRTWKVYWADSPISDDERELKNHEINLKKISRDLIYRIHLILRDAGSIPLRDFEDFYFKKFNFRLEWRVFGFESLHEMLLRFQWDFLEIVIKNSCFVVTFYDDDRMCMDQDILQFPPTNDSPNLVQSFPDYVIKSNESLPPLKLSDKLAEGDDIAVVVGDVKTPAHFYLQLREYSDQLNQLMDDMDQFYQGPESANYIMASFSCLPGVVVAAPYKDFGWHRGVITRVKTRESVIVYYVDYGSVWHVKKAHLRFLKKDFASIVIQSFRASLHGVEPLGGKFKSGCPASRRFVELSVAKVLVAHIYKFDPKVNIVAVSVVNTATNSGSFLDILVNEGLALRKEISADEAKEEKQCTHTSTVNVCNTDSCPCEDARFFINKSV